MVHAFLDRQLFCLIMFQAATFTRLVVLVCLSAGWSVALECPSVGVRLTGQQSEQVLVSAELHRLALAMPSRLYASLVVQQVSVQAASSSSSAGSSGSSMVPILQVPSSDLEAHTTQSYTRFGACSASEEQAQQMLSGSAHGDAGAATSPKPSVLGRIYSESPLSSYISHIQVRLRSHFLRQCVVVYLRQGLAGLFSLKLAYGRFDPGL